MLPFVIDGDTAFDYAPGDLIYVPGVREKVEKGESSFPARIVTASGAVQDITLKLGALTDDERDIILRGCLMNHYAARRKN